MKDKLTTTFKGEFDVEVILAKNKHL